MSKSMLFSLKAVKKGAEIAVQGIFQPRPGARSRLRRLKASGSNHPLPEGSPASSKNKERKESAIAE